ncbi:MAG: PD-(D/E)XK nuclease family protein [Planctomycetota bacterium]
MLFRLAVAAARERLVLTYPRVEPVSGSELIPSPLLLAAAEVLEGRRISISELDGIGSATRVPVHPPLERLDLEALDLVEFDLGLIAKAVRSGDAAAIRALAELQPTVLDALTCEMGRWTERRYTCFDGLLSRGLARELLEQPPGRAAGSPYSPSQLEEYAGCPFRSFARRVLGLPEPEEEDDLVAIDALERGSLLHSILERFLSGWIAAGEPFPPGEERAAAALEQLLLEARRQFDCFLEGRAPAHPFLFAIEKQRMEADLRFFLETEIEAAQGRGPSLFEVRFGREGGLPALLVGPGRIPVAGSIDRVDLAADGVHATVIDYKTGSTFPWKGELAGGRKVQLPLYALALEEVARPGRETVVDQAEYFFMTRKGNGVRRQAESDSWHGGEKSRLARAVRRIVSALRRGVFLADPRDGAQCEFCPYKLVCGLGAGLEQRFERKSRHGAVRRYFALEDA